MGTEDWTKVDLELLVPLLAAASLPAIQALSHCTAGPSRVASPLSSLCVRAPVRAPSALPCASSPGRARAMHGYVPSGSWSMHSGTG